MTLHRNSLKSFGHHQGVWWKKTLCFLVTLTFLILVSLIHWVLIPMETVAYSGKFQGNGNSIKGLVMDNLNDPKYKNAGLFCNLKNAVFDGLVIDESCSFSGAMAGGLSPSANGAFTVTNSKVKATVIDENEGGGFLGRVQSSNSEILFENCVFEGNASGYRNTGGFIGAVFRSSDATLNISNCTNNGNITSEADYAGGFVGYVTGSKNMALNVDNCTNNGIIDGKRMDVAGFFWILC